MTIALHTPWRGLNPHAARQHRMQVILAGTFPVIFLGLFVSLMWVQQIPAAQFDFTYFSVASIPLGLFAVWLTLMAWMSDKSDKAQAKALMEWALSARPNAPQLARISLSHELSSAEREAARKILDEQDAMWRARVLNNANVPEAAGPALPVLANQPASEAWLARILGLAMIGFIGMGLYGLLMLDEVNWGWVGAGLAGFTITLAAMFRWVDAPAEARQQQWDRQVRDRFTVEHLIMIEATGSDTSHGKRIRALLDEHHPGWTLSSARPLWAIVCKCDD